MERMKFFLNIIKLYLLQIILFSSFIYSQCDFQPGNPAGGTETVCFYDASDVLLGCSYNCQVTGQQIKCGYNAASVPYPTYYKVTFSTLICYSLAALPVGLSHFTIIRNEKNEYYECSWSTRSEKNNEYFELEKSSDGINFIKITKIHGAGTTNKSTDYRFIDKEVFPETTYYRLKQIDFNGDFKYYTTLSIEYIPTYIVKITFNPINNKLIKITSKNEIKEINIVSCTGDIIPHKKVEEYIDLEHINPGLIFIETILDNGIHVYNKYMNN